MADLNISINEGITIAESISAIIILPMDVSDSITIVENINIPYPMIEISVYEGITITEYALKGDEDFADFVRNYPFEEVTQFNVLVSTFENWWEQRRLKSSQDRKTFTINFFPITLSESNDILDYFVRRKGNTLSFKFTNPLDSVAYRVKFIDSYFKRVRIAYNTYKIQVVLLEVFE